MTDGLGIALFEDANIQDPYPLYRCMHETGPVHRIGNSGFYAVSGWDAVTDAVARPGDFSSNLTATMMFGPDGGVTPIEIAGLGSPLHALATADDPLHMVHRKALLPQLAAKRIRASGPFIVETAARLWESHAHDGEVEWMSAVADRLPMMVVGRIIGVPTEDIDKLMRWGYAATQVVEGLVTQEKLTDAGVAVMELGGYINEQFGRAAADPQGDLLGDLATACAAGELDNVAALTMMVTLFSAGGESTASLIGSAAWILASQPEVQLRLREQPELIGNFLEEVLRYEPPFRGHYRHVVTDTELAGVPLAAGSRLLLWGAANRDPAHFEDPDEFLLDRAESKGHISFGKGAHFCVGAALARLEARVVIDHLLEHTRALRAEAAARWLPSLLVRRLEHLQLCWR